MNPEPVKQERPLDDPWFVPEQADAADAAPESDPELDTEWFARGRPLSSRPPPPADTKG